MRNNDKMTSGNATSAAASGCRLARGLRPSQLSMAAAVTIATLGAVPLATTILAFDAAPAHAQGASGDRGNSGNAGGNNGDRGNSGNAGGGGRNVEGNSGGSNGRGELSAAFGALNAVNANPRALQNASPDSMPGRLYSYQQTGGITAEEIGQFAAAQSELASLTSLTPEEILATYDQDGDGVLSEEEEVALTAAIEAQQAVVSTFRDAYSALSNLGENGLSLTREELQALNAALGL